MLDEENKQKENLSVNDELKKKEPVDLSEPKNLVELIRNADDDLYTIEHHLSAHLDKLVINSSLNDYVVLFLYQPHKSIDESIANRIYNALPTKTEQKLLLILNSPGGRIEPAYLISKCCIERSSKFVVSIPRKAKSAATLIALGTEEIHMGSMNELGPIDPQFGGLPALGLSSALERLANLSTSHPASSDMFAKYLAEKLDLRILGYFERVSESAVQYAQRLLSRKTLPKKETPQSVAKRRVYSYKDHSFVIDKDEASQFLGNHVKTNTAEYQLGNEIHTWLDVLELFTSLFKNKYVSVVGSSKGFHFEDRSNED